MHSKTSHVNLPFWYCSHVIYISIVNAVRSPYFISSHTVLYLLLFCLKHQSIYFSILRNVCGFESLAESSVAFTQD